MRILVVSDYYPPFIGGAHRQTRLLARGLVARGHEVAVATIWYRGAADVEQDGPVEVHRVRQLRTAVPRLCGPGQRHQPPFPDPVSTLALRRLLRSYRPDVVHAYGGLASSAALALRGTGIPLVLVSRDYGYTCPKRTLVYEGRICPGPAPRRCFPCASDYYGAPKGIAATIGVGLTRPLLRRAATATVSVSGYVREIVFRDLLHGRPTLVDEVVPSFREGDEQAASGSGPVIDQLAAVGRPFLLFVGALRREKGVEELLAAYRRLDDPPPLVLVGTRERDTPAVLPDGVRVIEDATIPEVLAAWDRSLFGVLPSRWPEPFGSVVYEGMSRGRAVIGTRPGGHVDMIEDGVSGLLVPAGDVGALAEAMRRLIDDEELRDRLGAAARIRSRRFQAAEVLPRLEAVFARVTGSVVPA